MSKTTTIIVFIVALLVVGAGAFFGGMTFGKAQAATNQQAQFQRFASRAGQFPGNGQFPGGAQASGTPQAGAAGQGFARGGTVGTVEQIDGNTLIVSTTDGPVKVQITDTTLIQKTTEITAAELEKGSSVIVTGSRNDDGSITARSIMPAGNFGTQAGGQ